MGVGEYTMVTLHYFPLCKTAFKRTFAIMAPRVGRFLLSKRHRICSQALDWWLTSYQRGVFNIYILKNKLTFMKCSQFKIVTGVSYLEL